MPDPSHDRLDVPVAEVIAGLHWGEGVHGGAPCGRAFVVLGASCVGYVLDTEGRRRIDAIPSLGRHDLLVCTGGVVSPAQEGVPIAWAMREYAIERGVRPEQILLEEWSVTTGQALHGVAGLLADRPADLVLVSTRGHVRMTRLRAWPTFGYLPQVLAVERSRGRSARGVVHAWRRSRAAVAGIMDTDEGVVDDS